MHQLHHAIIPHHLHHVHYITHSSNSIENAETSVSVKFYSHEVMGTISHMWKLRGPGTCLMQSI